jgi:hypothetical protein
VKVNMEEIPGDGGGTVLFPLLQQPYLSNRPVLDPMVEISTKEGCTATPHSQELCRLP